MILSNVRSGFAAGIVGCGNVGSHVASLLVRMGATRIVLVDPDSYEEKNRTGQDIAAADVGRPKVEALAARLRRIGGQLEVIPRHEPVQSTPLGWLRTDVLLGCLDSRVARQGVNERAWHLGVPLVDAGLDATLGMARVDVFVPGRTGCLECQWSAADYATLEIQQPCEDVAPGVATNAPAYLGAHAASLQAAAVDALLFGGDDAATVGGRVTVSLHPYRQQCTAYDLNHACLFDHARWDIEPLDADPADLSVGDCLSWYGIDGRNADGIQMPGHAFARRLVCPECGFQLCVLRVLTRQGSESCPCCCTLMLVRGMDTVDVLRRSSISDDEADMSLQQLGLRPRDVLGVVTDEGERHVMLGDPCREDE